ncbi:MAG: hypothetical protein AAFZ17_00660 [Cyanobacteria bacterium J06650_10]
MKNNDLIQRAQHQLKYVYERVCSYQKGLLHHSIYILLENDIEQANRLCQNLEINAKSSIQEDFKIIERLVYDAGIQSHRRNALDEVADFVRSLDDSPNNDSEEIRMENTYKIIFGACGLIGIFAIVYNLNKGKKRKEEAARAAREKLTVEPFSRESDRNVASKKDNVRVLPPPIVSELCLVVTAKEVSGKKVGQKLSVEDVRYLLNNSPYFRCTGPREAREDEAKLTYSDEPILPNSLKDVYIRIEIDRGAHTLIGQKFPYIVSKNIPQDAICTIQQLSSLKDLTGLENFETV